MIQSFALTSAGHIVRLHSSGIVERQTRVDGPSGSYPVEWQDVSLEGIPGRVTQVAMRHDDRLVALAAGALYEQDRQLAWQPVL